jgi:hypothetical protein
MSGNATKTNIAAGLFKAFAFEQITVSNSAITLTASIYRVDSSGEKAKRALITCEDAQIRYTYDGTTPTSTVGHILNPMDTLVLTGSDNISNFKAIRKGSTDGKISVTYEN